MVGLFCALCFYKLPKISKTPKIIRILLSGILALNNNPYLVTLAYQPNVEKDVKNEQLNTTPKVFFFLNLLKLKQ